MFLYTDSSCKEGHEKQTPVMVCVCVCVCVPLVIQYFADVGIHDHDKDAYACLMDGSIGDDGGVCDDSTSNEANTSIPGNCSAGMITCTYMYCIDVNLHYTVTGLDPVVTLSIIQDHEIRLARVEQMLGLCAQSQP